MNRRVVLTSMGAVTLLGAGGFGLRARAEGRYTDAAMALRRPLDLTATGTERLAELVRMACLAPNSHNTQGWVFATRPDGVAITVDPARRTPVVDPDDHHLFVSLGCAVETLAIAASAYGVEARPKIWPDGTVTVLFAKGAERSVLIPAIVRRQSHRGVYDGTALSTADRTALMSADPDLRLIEDAPTRTALQDLTSAACAAQMSDPAYRQELKSWLRFSEDTALKTRDGLFSGCSGSPALPQALGRALFPVVVTAKGQAEGLGAQMASTPALVLLVTHPDTPAGRIKTGRRLARICLAATQAGLATAPVNPALEDPDTRSKVARLCDITTGRPSILLRVGRSAVAMPYSLRRPAMQVLLS
ncbi:MAG: Acg family FMN-binding oxidoreductase [Paracoccus hibiscisoli]|uniref:Acg family FMN-binding oxidoreductase n=1 Tax=Paracoccus hibiscisoli TaxID=2023261 RepID=UPI00391A2F88